MPIRINLLAEHFEIEEQKRRDPVKRAVMAGAFLVLCVCGYAASVYLHASTKEKLLAARQTEYRALESKYKQAMANNQLRSEIQAKLDMIESLAAERFIWAPTLNALQHALINGIQVTKIATEQKSQVVDSIKDTVDSRGNRKAGKKGGAFEEMTLNIEGKDFDKAGQNNHLTFQKKLADLPFFKTNLVADGIRLTKQDPPTVDPETQKTFAIFGFACSFPKRTWGDAK